MPKVLEVLERLKVPCGAGGAGMWYAGCYHVIMPEAVEGRVVFLGDDAMIIIPLSWGSAVEFRNFSSFRSSSSSSKPPGGLRVLYN